MKLPIHVQVTWLDALLETGEAGNPFETGPLQDVVEGQFVLSHGLLVQIGPVNLILALDSDKDLREVRGLQRIPKVLVHEIIPLNPAKPLSRGRLDSLMQTAGSGGGVPSRVSKSSARTSPRSNASTHSSGSGASANANPRAPEAAPGTGPSPHSPNS